MGIVKESGSSFTAQVVRWKNRLLRQPDKKTRKRWASSKKVDSHLWQKSFDGRTESAVKLTMKIVRDGHWERKCIRIHCRSRWVDNEIIFFQLTLFIVLSMKFMLRILSVYISIAFVCSHKLKEVLYSSLGTIICQYKWTNLLWNWIKFETE